MSAAGAAPQTTTATPPVDDVARSQALLTAVGFSLIPLAKPIAGAWDLLAVSPGGLTLIAAVSEKPNVLGTTYGGRARLAYGHRAADPRPLWGEAALLTAITLT